MDNIKYRLALLSANFHKPFLSLLELSGSETSLEVLCFGFLCVAMAALLGMSFKHLQNEKSEAEAGWKRKQWSFRGKAAGRKEQNHKNK